MSYHAHKIVIMRTNFFALSRNGKECENLVPCTQEKKSDNNNTVGLYHRQYKPP